MRTINHSEFQSASGEPVYVSHIHTSSRAEQKAVDAAAQAVVVPQAFVPLAGLVGKGGQFDPEEPWPSDATAREYAPEAVSGEYATQAVTPKTHFNGIPIRLPDGHLNPVAISAVIRKVRADKMPPNCDGNAQYGHEPTQSGQVLAHAMHTAAEGGEGCDSVACSITQGVSD